MNMAILPKTLLATAVVLSVGTGAALAQSNSNLDPTAAMAPAGVPEWGSASAADTQAAQGMTQPNTNDSARVVMPWYESGFANPTQLRNEMQSHTEWAGEG